MHNIQSINKRMVRFRKLTINLFLTLHGHNVHRQQRQLSKFLMRYQQFTSNAYYGAAGPVSKMESQQGKAFCVLRFEMSRSVITVQSEFRSQFRIDAPCVFSKPWQRDCHHDMKVTPEAATAVIELLMMGGKTLETCWVRIINWKIVASGWWFIWIVRRCTDLQTLNFTFKF